MKTFLLILVMVLPSAFLFAQKAGEAPYLVKSLSGESIKNVEVKTSGGSISVTGVNQNETKVEVYVTAANNKSNLSKEEIQQRINEKYELTVSVSNNKLTATAKSKGKIIDWNNSLMFSFKVYVPVSVSTDLSTSGGSISLNNLTGNLDFATSGGSLSLDNVGGKIDGKTSGGSISVSNSKNEINLSTSGGSIDAKNCDGTIKLSTSGGSLNLQNLKGDIKATTSGGSIKGNQIEGTLATTTSGGNIHLSDMSCSIETSTSGGNIDVDITIPGKYIKIGNSAGNINLQLPKTKGYDLDISAQKITTENIGNFSGSMGDKEIKGQLNGGGIPVSVKSGGGKINLQLR